MGLIAYVTFALSVDNTLYEDDKLAIQTLAVDAQCQQSKGVFVRELACIKSIQLSIQAIGVSTCAKRSDTIEPMSFIKRQYGCCYDRARFIEKAARYYGYQTRHVFLIQRAYNTVLSHLLPLNQSTHATSEILTTDGWLGVDSNRPFILLSPNGRPKTYREAMDALDEFSFMEPYAFYDQDIDVIYGLYSRHGRFHGKQLPGPEYVLSELLWNF